MVFNIETQPNSSWKQDGNVVSINYEIVYSVYVINKTASIASVPFRNSGPWFSSVFPALPRFNKLVYIKIDFDRHFDHCKRPQKKHNANRFLSLKLNIDHTSDEHKYFLLVEFSL